MNKPPSRAGTSSIWKWIKDAHGHQERPSPKALADLARRQALGPRADLTGQMLGDPPPGRSALEKKLEAERRRAEALVAGKAQSSIEDLDGGCAGEKDEA